MKKILTNTNLAFALSIAAAQAQTEWSYDFGTTNATWTSNAASTTFLPSPEAGGGTARVRVGSGGGSFTLTNVSGFGADSALVGVAPTATSVNKFSIYDWTNPTSAFSLSFDMRLTGGSSGIWSLFTGDGATFSNNSTSFTGSETFLGLRMAFGADGAINISNRASGNWAAIAGTGISQSNSYTISIFGNNASASTNYVLNNTNYSLASGSWDLWVGGSLVGTNLSKAQLSTNASIDSFMFYGESSTGNVATLALDNFTYANYAVPEPSSYAMLALAGAGFAGYVIRRRRR
jgi:hypothetical protein